MGSLSVPATRKTQTRPRRLPSPGSRRVSEEQIPWRNHNAVMGCLRNAGFSFEMALHAYSVQDAYIYGFVPLKSMW